MQNQHWHRRGVARAPGDQPCDSAHNTSHHTGVHTTITRMYDVCMYACMHAYMCTRHGSLTGGQTARARTVRRDERCALTALSSIHPGSTRCTRTRASSPARACTKTTTTTVWVGAASPAAKGPVVRRMLVGCRARAACLRRMSDTFSSDSPPRARTRRIFSFLFPSPSARMTTQGKHAPGAHSRRHPTDCDRHQPLLLLHRAELPTAAVFPPVVAHARCARVRLLLPTCCCSSSTS